MADLNFILQICVALVCGILIGLERQWRQRHAGLRTCTLVTVGAAIFSTLDANAELASTNRVAAQIVTGVGFLGAGCIMRSGFNVRGLNTAGTLWCAAAVGVLAGAGLIIEAFLSTVAVLFINLGLRPVVKFINQLPNSGKEGEIRYMLTLSCRERKQQHLRQLLVQYLQPSLLRLQQLESAESPQTGHVALKAELVSDERADSEMENLCNRLGLESGVTAISWQMIQHTDSSKCGI
ncbi:MAG: MgtC/SapB family protein [Methylacidiphilales bacterium]|nr:MgtC/SapB family protein [Candidatus Methylacidiphilales bacterium]MDW8350044.1 MgtC/SapB family protein [Verrucomicrobiae bacterium]